MIAMQDSCEQSNRKILFQKKILTFYKHMRDRLERRLSAVNATIETLTEQIERDSLNN